MSEFLLGWGTNPYGEGGYPSYEPLSPDNSGSLTDYGGTWYYGVAPDGQVPEGAVAEMHYTFYPADGGPTRTASDAISWSYEHPGNFFREGSWDPILTGVYEVELYVDGVRAANKLVLTVMEPEYGYSSTSYYATGGSGNKPAFWTAFKGALENP